VSNRSMTIILSVYLLILSFLFAMVTWQTGDYTMLVVFIAFTSRWAFVLANLSRRQKAG
jgi:hypothetical protein